MAHGSAQLQVRQPPHGGRVRVQGRGQSGDARPQPPPYGDGGPDGANDGLLAGTGGGGNLCALGAISGNRAPAAMFKSRCPGGRCLLTGRNGKSDRGRLEACCAWDLLLDMGDDDSGGGYYYDDGDAVPLGDKEPITIPVLFVTMEKGGELRVLVADADAENVASAGSVGYIGVVAYGR